jgi:hypothetical protein
MNTVFRNIGQSLGAPIAGSILSTFVFTVFITTAKGKVPYAFPTLAAFQYTYYIAAVTFVAGIIISLLAREVMGKRAKAEFAIKPSSENSTVKEGLQDGKQVQG